MRLPDDLAVDAHSLGLSDYFSIVKKPMDLSLVATKLEKRKYKLLKQVGNIIQLDFIDSLIYFSFSAVLARC
jgi:hypothetical protein